MVEKAFVLRGRDGLHEHRGQLGKADRPPFLAIATNDVSDQDRFEAVSLEPGLVVGGNEITDAILVEFSLNVKNGSTRRPKAGSGSRPG